jgi:hypothetical protein
MRNIVLADRYNTHEIIKEEKEQWVSNLLVLLGVDPNEITENNQELLKKYNIQVWEQLGIGDVEIIQNNTLVGKWYAPELIAKYDEKNNIYYEIHIDYNSIFDNEFNSP